jgi:EmrB/QacA subfamily drug resistance transporter
MVVLDFSIVNVALPSIERELHMPPDAVQWIVTGYAISFGGLLILGGRAADLLGRRRMFVAGLIAFALASLAGGLAQDPALLIAARVIQGAGAAIVAPAALSLITTSFPEGPKRTRAIGLYGAISSVGFVAGQVLGGVLVEFTSWRAVFLVNVPVGLAAAALAPAILGSAKATSGPHRLDVRGALLITSAVTLVVFAVSQGVILGWTSPLVIAAIVGAAAAAAGFLKAETKHPEPLIRLSLLHRTGLRNGSTLSFLLGLWNGGEMLILSLYLQQVLHESPLFTGLAIAPQGVVGFGMGLLGPRLAGRIGIKRLLVLTGASAAIGFAVLTRLPAGGYSPVLLVVMLIGLGTAGTAFGSVVLASRGMADADQGLVGGMINTSRQIGAAMGAALLPAVAESVSGAPVSGDRAAMLTAGLAALAATAVAWHAAHPYGQLRSAARFLCRTERGSTAWSGRGAPRRSATPTGIRPGPRATGSRPPARPRPDPRLLNPIPTMTARPPASCLGPTGSPKNMTPATAPTSGSMLRNAPAISAETRLCPKANRVNGTRVPASASAATASTGPGRAGIEGAPSATTLKASAPSAAPRNCTAVTAAGSRPGSSRACATVNAADTSSETSTRPSPRTLAPPPPPPAVISATPPSEIAKPSQASGRATVWCHSAAMTATSTGTAPISRAA